jgi:hypothetical protein
MENKSITAVEWLQNCLNIHLSFEQKMQFEGLFQQAKEMQDKQMIDYGRFCVQCEKQGFIIPKNK